MKKNWISLMLLLLLVFVSVDVVFATSSKKTLADFNINDVENWSLEESQEYADAMAEKIKDLKSAGGSRADFLEGVILLDKFERSFVAKDFGLMAEGVYGNNQSLSALSKRGWVEINDVSKLGLTQDILSPRGFFDGIEVRVFIKDKKITFVFKDTIPASRKDWAGNLLQERTGDSPYYAHARFVAKLAEEYAFANGLKLSFAGHSSGGGLALAAGAETGRIAYGFNPTRLSKKIAKNEIFDDSNLKIFVVGDKSSQ